MGRLPGAIPSDWQWGENDSLCLDSYLLLLLDLTLKHQQKSQMLCNKTHIPLFIAQCHCARLPPKLANNLELLNSRCLWQPAQEVVMSRLVDEIEEYLLLLSKVWQLKPAAGED
jgi:hypothetical protein